jgi:GNAT superfamily N-acetyltransferase
MYARPPAAWLGFAATLPEARGQGAQGALLVERVRRAAALGCPLVTLETGERVPDRPDASYRNILRQGFFELYLRPNFYSPDPPAG